MVDLLGLSRCNTNDKQIIFLFDDVDMLAGTSSSFNSPTEFSVISVLIHAVDVLHSHPNASIICTSTQPADQLHERLRSSCRLTEVIAIQPPSASERRVYLIRLLQDSQLSILINSRVPFELKVDRASIALDAVRVCNGNPVLVCGDAAYSRLVVEYLLHSLVLKTEVRYLRMSV